MCVCSFSCTILPTREFLCLEDVTIFLPEEDSLLSKASASSLSSRDLSPLKFTQGQWRIIYWNVAEAWGALNCMVWGDAREEERHCEHVCWCIGESLSVWVSEDIYQGD